MMSKCLTHRYRCYRTAPASPTEIDGEFKIRVRRETFISPACRRPNLEQGQSVTWCLFKYLAEGETALPLGRTKISATTDVGCAYINAGQNQAPAKNPELPAPRTALPDKPPNPVIPWTLSSLAPKACIARPEISTSIPGARSNARSSPMAMVTTPAPATNTTSPPLPAKGFCAHAWARTSTCKPLNTANPSPTTG